ncbi:MAG: hypothetical protein JWQ40_3111, partial [Segetibacter sp.]|nr:hypothetical protein [Segetibacter sp.]
MKQILFILLLVCSAFMANAQLENTRWLGKIQAGGNTLDVIFRFNNDTVTTTLHDDGSSIDVSTFKVRDSTITFIKVSGQSSCNDAPGKYKFLITGKHITFTKLGDDCYDRSGAIDKS